MSKVKYVSLTHCECLRLNVVNRFDRRHNIKNRFQMILSILGHILQPRLH